MKKILLIIVGLSLLFSCNIDPNRKKKDRIRLIEENTQVQTDSLKQELDSICVVNHETEMERLVDSVLEVRLAEIKEKLKSYNQ